MFKEIYKYREFLKTSIRKEFRGKYKKSVLGILWSFLNPLCQLLIYALVFPFILRVDVENYTMFLVVTLIPWSFFNMTVIQSAASVVANGGIIKKVYFPREILPLSVATSNLINFFITGSLVIIALLLSGIGLGKAFLVLPLVILIQYIFQLGLSFILSSITVFVRDVEYIINLLIMLMFYMCPIVYSADMIPDKFLPLFQLNPMFHIINFYREILYYQRIPNFLNLLIMFIISITFLMLGYSVFKKLEKRFAEEL